MNSKCAVLFRSRFRCCGRVHPVLRRTRRAPIPAYQERRVSPPEVRQYIFVKANILWHQPGVDQFEKSASLTGQPSQRHPRARDSWQEGEIEASTQIPWPSSALPASSRWVLALTKMWPWQVSGLLGVRPVRGLRKPQEEKGEMGKSSTHTVLGARAIQAPQQAGDPAATRTAMPTTLQRKDGSSTLNAKQSAATLPRKTPQSTSLVKAARLLCCGVVGAAAASATASLFSHPLSPLPPSPAPVPGNAAHLCASTAGSGAAAMLR